MSKQRSSDAFTALLAIAFFSVAMLAGACRRAGEPASNSSAPKSSTAASSGAADFEGMISLKMENEAQNSMEMTYFLKGRHTRIETKALSVPEAQSIMLWDMEGGKITTLMPARKMYMTIDMKAAAEEMKGMAKDMKKSRGEEDDAKFPKLTPTGKQETIAGYTCDHWLMGEKQELDICVAKGLGYFGMGGESGGGDFSAFKNFAFSPKLLDEAASHPEWVKFLEGGAFPLKLQVVDEGKVKMSMEATRVERRVLDDSLFAIPAGYKEMTIPTMPAGRK
jgi:hypothetical protein